MILTTLIAAAALHGLPPPVLAPQNTSEATAEGVEILRRILVEALNEAFEDKKDGDKVMLRRQGFEVHGLVTTLFADNQTVQHSRAFHLPDAGLFFALDASLPVVVKEPSETEKSDQPTDDEWERARREVRGSNSPDGLFRRLRLATPVATEIDPKAVDKVIDVALRTLARHATRIEGLTSRETITVALRLGGRSRTLLHDYENIPQGVYSLEAPEENDEAEAEAETFSYVLATGHDVRDQSLVLRIAVSDLAGFAEGGVDRLRQRAQINRY